MEILKDGLLRVVANMNKNKREINQQKAFSFMYNSLKGAKDSGDLKSENLPRFYRSSPREDEKLLEYKLQVEARSLQLQRKSALILEEGDLRTLWTLLEANSDDSKIIGYERLKELLMDGKWKEYLSARLCAQLLGGEGMSIDDLFNYCMRKCWLVQTRLSLCQYDPTGRGFLREQDLERFVEDLLSGEASQMEKLSSQFRPFYICTIVRKFMFFLDPMRTGSIRILDILHCGFLDDLMLLRSRRDEEQNWFSTESALNLYGQYIGLDLDHNGMLSKSELAALGTGTLTQIFVNRLFQECLTYGGEMDYKGYLDFMLALRYKQHPQALRYFFRIFDINGTGYLDTFCLKYFFMSVQDEMKKRGQEPVNFEDVKDELFDMVKPVHQEKITFTDISKCGQGGIFVGILSDLNEFWNNENKEALESKDKLHQF